MSYVGRVSAANADHFVASTAYGVCGTAAGTVAKVVVMEDFDTLLTGVTIHVLFQNSNTAESPTLNVNNTGAKPIYTRGIIPPGDTPGESWESNSILSFTYDGSAWRMNDGIGAIIYDIESLKSRGLSLMALASGWSSDTYPTQTVTANGVTTTNNIIVGLPSSITLEQYNAAVDAEIICSAQSTNSITLKCYGYKPLIDIPLSVVILG